MAEEVPSLIRGSRHRLALILVTSAALAGSLAILIFWGSADRRRAEEMRRELVLEIERERAAALERAARQRKELNLEVEPPG